MARSKLAAQAPAKIQVEAKFDSLALEYAHERDRQVSFIEQKRIVLQMLSGMRGRLLEVGCGPAVMTPDLLAMGFQVQGIDVSGEMIRQARQHMAGHPLEKGCDFALGDVERLSFADASFEAVLAMGVLEYLPDYARALQETARVLKPGGIAVFTVPNRASCYHIARRAYRGARGVAKRILGREDHTSVPNRCIPWVLDRNLAAAGLRKVDGAACNFMFFPLKEWHAGASDALNRLLAPIARAPVARVLGAQYIVKARRSVPKNEH